MNKAAQITFCVALLACGYAIRMLDSYREEESQLRKWNKNRLHLEGEFGIVRSFVEKFAAQNGALPSKLPSKAEYLQVMLKGVEFTSTRPRQVVEKEGLEFLEAHCDFSSFLCVPVLLRDVQANQVETLFIIKPIDEGDELHTWMSFTRSSTQGQGTPAKVLVDTHSAQSWRSVVKAYESKLHRGE